MPIEYKIHLVISLAQVMEAIGFRRRWALLLNELLHLLIPLVVQARVVGASEWGMHPSAALELSEQIFDDDGLVQLMKRLTSIYGASSTTAYRVDSGWPVLRTDILSQCLGLCESLPHPAGVVHFTSLLLSVVDSYHSKDAQMHLAGNLPRAIATGRRKGINVEVDYWDHFAIQDIELLPYRVHFDALLISQVDTLGRFRTWFLTPNKWRKCWK
jgi:Transport protein Trs120 or TRAPPC9, TRAPP II complex subunit